MTVTGLDEHVLDAPVWNSLHGPHAHLAEHRGNVVRYPPDVSPFLALPARPTDADWADLAALAGPGAVVPLNGVETAPPDDWDIVSRGAGVQLVDDGVVTAPFDDAVVLTVDDIPEMLDLVTRTRPGPFLPRTIAMGTYLGVRRGGALVAMAGERLYPPGWTEISAVCTDPEFRGRGLATALVRAVAHGIRSRGETPLLHAAATNTVAIDLYLSLGFRLRRRTTFDAARVPGGDTT